MAFDRTHAELGRAAQGIITALVWVCVLCWCPALAIVIAFVLRGQ